MGFFKSLGYVVGGAAIGVVAVALSPIAGPVGTITALGAGIASTGGGLSGAGAAALDDSEEEAYHEGRRDEAKKYAAHNDLEIESIKKKLGECLSYIESCSGYFNSIISLHAVAASVITNIHEITNEERLQLESFISGFIDTELPEKISTRINSIYEKPVSMAEAYKLAMKSGLSMGGYDEVIAFSLIISGATSSNKTSVFDSWDKIRVI